MVHFLRVRLTGKTLPKQNSYLFIQAGTAPTRYVRCKRTAAVDEQRLIEQRKCLERSVRSFAPRTTHDAVGGIEGHQHRIGQRALKENIKAAPILIFGLIRLPLPYRPIKVVGQCSNISGNWWPKTPSANPELQQTAGGQLRVSYLLGR